MSGRAAGKPWTQRISVDFSKADSKDGEGLPSAWARQKIEYLSNTSADEQVSGESTKDLQEQITQVALGYHLMSPYTSFVAVEPTVVNIGGQQKTVEVPVEMADGVSYKGIFGDRDEAMGAGGGATFAYSLRAAPMASASVPRRATGGPRSGVTMGVRLSRKAPSANVSLLAEEQRAMLPSPQQLAAMKPAERIKAIRAAKMSKAVALLAAKTKPEKVTVQFWLSPLATSKAKADFAVKLKALGWTQSAVLTPGKLVLGTINSDKLDELAALEGVRLIDAPKFK